MSNDQRRRPFAAFNAYSLPFEEPTYTTCSPSGADPSAGEERIGSPVS